MYSLKLMLEVICRNNPDSFPSSFIDSLETYARSDRLEQSGPISESFMFHSGHLELMLELIRQSNPGLYPESFNCNSLSLCSSLIAQIIPDLCPESFTCIILISRCRWSVEAFQICIRRGFLQPSLDYAREHSSHKSRPTSGESHLYLLEFMLELISQFTAGLCPKSITCTIVSLYSRWSIRVFQDYFRRDLFRLRRAYAPSRQSNLHPEGFVWIYLSLGF